MQRLAAYVSTLTSPPRPLSLASAQSTVNTLCPANQHGLVEMTGEFVRTDTLGPADGDLLRHIISSLPMTCESSVQLCDRVFSDYRQSIRTPADFGALVRLNVIYGFNNNARILGIRFNELHREGYISPFNNPEGVASSRMETALLIPSDLRPTALQTSMVHHPWLDILPMPGMRDNILRLVATDSIDEYELCADMMNMEDSKDDNQAPIMVWAESCYARGWEFSPAFLRKWACLWQNCPEVLDATNFWRERRGRPRITMDDLCV
jgi:hypothetical protein